MLPHETAFSQRWRHGLATWQRRRDGGFDRHRYLVAAGDERAIRGFVQQHHYSAAWPAARLRFGLWDRSTGLLVGALVLGVPMHPAVLTGPFPELEPYQQSLELSRLVLLDQVPSNAESWFCTQVFALAHDCGIRGLVAYADPMPRTLVTEGGPQVLMPGHVGTVYQACGAVYTGRGRARPTTFLPDGTVLTDRAIAKLLAGDQGAHGVLTRLSAFAGAIPYDGADPRAWLNAHLRAIGATQTRHPGNHRYLFALGSRRRRTTPRIALPAQPYPKKHQPTLGLEESYS
jgi:hypothetical protein